MSRNHVNTHVAGAYHEARDSAQDLVDTGLPKATIQVQAVRQGADFALSAVVESMGPYPEDEVQLWLDCVRQEVCVNWVDLAQG